MGIALRQNAILKEAVKSSSSTSYSQCLHPGIFQVMSGCVRWGGFICIYLADHSPQLYWKNKQHFANKTGPLNLPRVVISLSPKLWNIWGLAHSSRYLVRLNYIQGNANFFFLHTKNYLFCGYEDKLTFQRKACTEVVLTSTFLLSVPFYFLTTCEYTEHESGSDGGQFLISMLPISASICSITDT